MFTIDKIDNKRILKSDLVEDKDVYLFFGTRDIPIKTGERKDFYSITESNKYFLAKYFNIPYENIIIPNQTHSDNIEVVKLDKVVYENCDGLITDKKDIAIALNFADCVPIIMYDPEKKVIGVCHAGWRGTYKKIVEKTVKEMNRVFNSDIANLKVLIGPAISKCCYNVSKDVLIKLVSTIHLSQRDLVYSNNYVDLKLINKYQLQNIGVKDIDVTKVCTSCQNDLFFSYRKDNKNTGRHFAFALLK